MRDSEGGSTLHDLLARAMVVIGLVVTIAHLALLLIYGRQFAPYSIWYQFLALGALTGFAHVWLFRRASHAERSAQMDERDLFIAGRGALTFAGFAIATAFAIAVLAMFSSMRPEVLPGNLLAWAAWLAFLMNWIALGLARILAANAE